MQINPNVMFLIQIDETEFIEFMTICFPNSFYFKDETRHMKKYNSTVDHVMHHTNHFPNIILQLQLSCQNVNIVCGSGNCSILIMLYRGNNTNVYQYLNGSWHETF